MLGKLTFAVTVLSRREMIFSSRATERINIGFLEPEKKGQKLKIVIRPVLERSFKAVAAVKLKHSAIEGERSVT